MSPTATNEYTSSVTLLILGEFLEPNSVSARLGIEPHESWMKGQPKRVGTDLHEWGGWKRRLPDALKTSSVEEQLSYWIDELTQKTQQLASLVASGARCSLDVFISADAAWLKLSPEFNHKLAEMPLDIEFTFWASSSGAHVQK